MNKKTKIALAVINKFITNVLSEQKMRLYDFNIALKAICVIAFEYGFNIGDLLDKEGNNAEKEVINNELYETSKS